jgi:hypothetical protein
MENARFDGNELRTALEVMKILFALFINVNFTKRVIVLQYTVHVLVTDLKRMRVN